MLNMSRKHSHYKIIKISRAQIEAVERQYLWATYNNSELSSMLLCKPNTNTNG